MGNSLCYYKNYFDNFGNVPLMTITKHWLLLQSQYSIHALNNLYFLRYITYHNDLYPIHAFVTEVVRLSCVLAFLTAN